MRFWDASALLPLLFDEPSTRSMKRLLALDRRVCVWWATATECMSAIARIERERRSLDRVNAAIERLDRIRNDWIEVEPSEEVRDTARRLLRVHPLGPAGAFQLAAAITLASGAPSPVAFVCLDAPLRDAAAREGFPLLPSPNERETSRSRRR